MAKKGQARFSRAQLDGMREAIRALPNTPAPGWSSREAVEELAADISQAQSKGYTLEMVLRVLSGEGLAISLSTMRGYMRGKGGARASKKAAARASKKAGTRARVPAGRRSRASRGAEG